ncbi:hypothetical protein [Streptomyces sp. CCM_MD2014]|uniref:hypothetical protein n=1 Tax=Streptomyces sp. CCM_MD2014 TaxID=1561022 RepID=UPI000B10B0D3|nr:hypothetical protein [Streptomyces sp. CCM_MD2014]
METGVGTGASVGTKARVGAGASVGTKTRTGTEASVGTKTRTGTEAGVGTKTRTGTEASVGTEARVTPCPGQAPCPGPASRLRGGVEDPPDRVRQGSRRSFGRLRPPSAEQAEHAQPAHQQRHVQRTPPGRRAQDAQGGTGQDC